MSARTTPRDYTIKDAAALTGLPASTLRYYESVGVIAPVSRGEIALTQETRRRRLGAHGFDVTIAVQTECRRPTRFDSSDL